jgi:hypothetical protein
MTVYTDDQMVDDLAQQLFASLTQDAPTPPVIDFDNPDFNFIKDADSELYTTPTSVTLAQLTEVELLGEGVFDKLMAAVDLHIQREYKGNRITGDQYAKVYTELVGGVLSNSTSFLLQKDQAKWAAITAQMQARIAEIQAVEARINLEKVKIETLKAVFDMKNSGAVYALTKLSLATENAKSFLMAEQVRGETFKNDFMLPAELAIQNYQRMQVLPSSVAINKIQSDRILPAEAAMKEFANREIQPIERDTALFNLNSILDTKHEIDAFQLASILPVTLAQEQHKLNYMMPAQTALLKEQHESQRAQTMDTRSDNLTTVVGVLGKQKALYTQQIDSFIKDAKYKTTKMYLDGWITQKTLDEGLLAPTELQNASINSVLSGNRTANGL